MENDKRYTVYIHIFPNGKRYIGMTSRKTSERWRGGRGYNHQQQVAKAIDDFGWKNIKHCIVKEGLNQPEAELLEAELIKLYRSNNPQYGYNIANGGIHGNTCSKSTREKMKKAKAGEGNPFYGKHLSDEHKSKIRETRKKMDLNNPVNKQPILCVETGIVYESTAAATRQTGIHNYSIRRVCYGKRKTAGGYHWKYV